MKLSQDGRGYTPALTTSISSPGVSVNDLSREVSSAQPLPASLDFSSDRPENVTDSGETHSFLFIDEVNLIKSRLRKAGLDSGD